MGVFDGYDGDIASRQCSSQLHLAILDTLSKSRGETCDWIKFNKEAYEYDEINHLEKFADERTESEEKIKTDGIEETMEKTYQRSFKTAFDLMDRLLARGKGETSRVRWSGATAFSCVIERREDGQGWIHFANCGKVFILKIVSQNQILTILLCLF